MALDKRTVVRLYWKGIPFQFQQNQVRIDVHWNNVRLFAWIGVTLPKGANFIMALTSVGYEGYVNLIDTEGSRSNMRYALTAIDHAGALSSMSDVIAALDAVTDAVIESYGVLTKYAEDNLTLPATAEIEKRAVISCKIEDSFPTKYVNLFIPAPNVGIFLAATGPNAAVVDTNDAALIAYLELFGAGTNVATVSDGEQIVAPATAGAFTGRKGHRGSRSG